MHRTQETWTSPGQAYCFWYWGHHPPIHPTAAVCPLDNRAANWLLLARWAPVHSVEKPCEPLGRGAG
jgi:hypothetical protein